MPTQEEKKQEIKRHMKEKLADAVQAVADAGGTLRITSEDAAINIVVDDIEIAYEWNSDLYRVKINGADITEQIAGVSIALPRNGVPTITPRMKPRTTRIYLDKNGKVKDSHVLENPRSD